MVVHTYVCTGMCVVTSWAAAVCLNCMSGHMATYSDAKVVEITAHLGVMRWSSHPLAPPYVIDVKLVINVFNNLLNSFVYHCTCQGKLYSNISKEYIVQG